LNGQMNGADGYDSNGECATDRTSDDEATYIRLAGLSAAEYDRRRDIEAQSLGIRVSTLDDEVKKRRSKSETATGQGRAFSLPDPEPWPEPVDLAAALASTEKHICQHVSLVKYAIVAIVLWVVHSHALTASLYSPRLAVTSPEPRCGKSTLLRLLRALCPRALSTEGINSATMFRIIEMYRPTLIVDEADTFVRDSEDIRGVINSGHHRNGEVYRCVGDDHEPRGFSTWSALVIACIGKLQATIMDRAIEIQMRRKSADESVIRFRDDRCPYLIEDGRKIARWVADHLSELTDADPDVPPELHDRAADNWRPLFAIANLAGGEWPARARQAANALSSGDAAADDSIRTGLLIDTKDIFTEIAKDRIRSEDLIERLVAKKARPWPEWKHGKPITQRQLASLLKPYGIGSKQLWIEGGNRHGYELGDFADAFKRYLPRTSARPLEPAENRHSSGIFAARPNSDLADENAEISQID
jgi:Protein of unknown function (DUF3631)